METPQATPTHRIAQLATERALIAEHVKTEMRLDNPDIAKLETWGNRLREIGRERAQLVN